MIIENIVARVVRGKFYMTRDDAPETCRALKRFTSKYARRLHRQQKGFAVSRQLLA